MEISDEDKLIANGELFFSVRSYMRQKKSSDEIIAKIEEVLKQGADITACDGNDNNNTILHIAVQKEEKEVVEYILEKGATLFSDQNKQTTLQLALQKNTPVGKEIAKILSAQCVSFAQNKKEDPSKHKNESKQNNQKPSVISTVNDQEYTYPKRGGTSGVSGQFYETKLLSLVLHRALHDRDIKDFYLAANIKDIGDFDDVCFRYDNVACFMQTKHRENIDKAKLTVASVRSSTGKLGLGIYFDSFLKIRQKFSPNATDPMFQGKFEDIDCYFVLYTPLKESFELKLSGNKPMCKKLHEIIFSGDTKAIEKIKSTDMFQFDFQDYDLDFLTKFIKHEHMKTLAKTFLEFILSNNKLEAMMASDLIKLYHPALAQKVIYITKILETPKPVKNNKNSKNQANATNSTNILSFTHVGRFRSEFFYSQDPNLNILKKTFFKEIVYTHSGKTTLTKEDLRFQIDEMARDPCPETISPLIGSPIKFDDTNDKLSLDTNKLPKNMFKHEEIQQIKFALQKITVTRVMVEHAVSLAGEKKLRNLNFPLPQSFGNIDLTTNQKTLEGVQSRLDFLAGKFQKLIDHFSETNRNKEVKVININSDVVGPGKILEHTHLSSNGGIGGAVGNLLEFDMQDECFIFNTKYYLAENAKYVLNKVNELTGEDLTNYKINILIDSFPRVCFNVYKYDKKIAAMFLQKLWFYTNQAQEEAVEIAVKNEISIHYNADKQLNQFLFHVHSDAIFLRFHDKIQKWWKRQTDAQYLTKNTNIYEKAKQDIVDSPLLTVLNVMFIRRIKTLDIEFNVNAIDHLNLDEFMNKDLNKTLNIVSDAVMLSAAKIMQCSKYKNHTTFINLDYIHILPTNDYNTMMQELEEVRDVTLVIISETPLEQDLQDTLINILSAFSKHCETQPQLKRQIIIITGEPLNVEREIIKNYDYVTIKDNHLSLIDLTSRTQSSFLQTCDIIYQGQEVKLNTIIDDNAKDLISAKLLWLLLNKEKMEIGHSLDTPKYNEIRNHYIHRDLKLDDDNCVVNTLDDIDDKVVLISSKPGMGKSILLTHLSLETKKVDPKLWIVRINLSKYDKSFEKLNKRDIQKVVVFLGKAALKNPDEINKATFTAIDNETVSINSDDYKDISFELQLFIHCYNSGNIIFLFDSFEKCYPQNTNEGIELFTALQQANKRIWVTGDYYVITILENIFGTAYTLDCISTIQQKSFLERFWMTNLRLDKLNHDQFDNIITFFNYILRAFNHELDINEMHKRPIMPLFSVPLHVLYLTLIDHFKDEANSISPCYFRDKLKRQWSLDSFTKVDHYLRTCSTDKSLQLEGTPLHLYIAANYFVFQITDKFDLHLDTKLIQERSNFYINAITLFERFLKSNMKTICEVENKNTIGSNQEKVRNEFLENHKKLALYAIYKECDIGKILSPAEIMEAKKTINLIESGELKTGLIDTVVDGVPRFYHALFAEYFLVEFLADILSRVKNNSIESLNPTSFWNFLVNTVLVTSPASLRHAFEYKLKYDPELAETINDEDSKKITLDLLAKPSTSGSNSNSTNIDKAIDIVVGEGLVNIANLLIKKAPPNIESIVERTTTVLQSSANILVAVNPEQKVLSEDLLNCIKNPNAETVMQVLKSNDIGNDIHTTINKKIVDPVKKISKDILEASQNNENLVRLFNEFPKHLPDYIRQIFPKE